MYGGQERCIQGFVGEICWKEATLIIGLYVTIILKCIFKKRGGEI